MLSFLQYAITVSDCRENNPELSYVITTIFASRGVSSIIISADAAGLKRQNMFKLTNSDFLVIFDSGLYFLIVISTHCDRSRKQGPKVSKTRPALQNLTVL